MQTTKPRDTLPSNPDAEHALIGYLLKNYKRVPEIQEILPTPEAFSPGADREIYKAILAVSSMGLDPDSYHVPVHLREIGSAVTTETLGNRMMNAPATGGLDLAQLVLKSWVKRDVLTKLDEARETATRPGTTLAELEGMVSSAADCFLAGTPGHGSTELHKILNDVQAAAIKGPDKRKIHTCFPALNDIIVGLSPAELIVLAARTSNGKTAIALYLAGRAAQDGFKVGIMSLEMSKQMLGQRLCSSFGNIPAQKIRTGNLNQSDLQTIKRLQLEFQSLSLRVHDSPRVDPDIIRATCRAWARKGGLDFVVIDYLQLINPAGGKRREGTREREVAEISRAMKQLAIELDIPILLLAQLNRDMEKDGRTEPKLSDLRESGAIEQDADQVWLLSSWDPSNRDAVIGVDLKVAKSRSSGTGTVKLGYYRDYLRFHEAAQ